MFNPVDFLNFSNSILNSKSITKNDAVCRSIISRSYYSAFLTTREKIDKTQNGLLTHGSWWIKGKRKESHKEIIDAVLLIKSAKFNRQQKNQLHNRLQKLHIYRTNADYKFPNAVHGKEQKYIGNLDPTTISAAQYTTQSAQRIISQISKL